MHFVIEEWVKSGHTVHFTTIGYSALSRLKNDPKYEALKANQANTYEEIGAGLHAGAYLPLFHGFSSGRPSLAPLEDKLFKLYGRQLPPFVSEKIEDADVVLLESGTALVFADLVRHLNPEAALVYFCRDILSSIGASSALWELEQHVANSADLVVVPSRLIGEQFPQSGTVHFVPQGIRKSLFSSNNINPYLQGSRNVVIVGNMLFDTTAVSDCARANPNINFHLFGIHWRGLELSNVIVHGEVSFEDLVPYLKHADFGMAPYRIKPKELYLAESSLKLMQYAYCLLPVLLPFEIPSYRGNEVRYNQNGPNDWPTLVDQAINLAPDTAWRKEILDWSEVAELVLEPLLQAQMQLGTIAKFPDKMKTPHNPIAGNSNYRSSHNG